MLSAKVCFKTLHQVSLLFKAALNIKVIDRSIELNIRINKNCIHLVEWPWSFQT